MLYGAKVLAFSSDKYKKKKKKKKNAVWAESQFLSFKPVGAQNQ